MRDESNARHEGMRPARTDPSEAGLLELFAPTLAPIPVAVAAQRRDLAHLWRADAIHRAKNMAQLSTSFAEVADHPSRNWLPAEVTRQARCLSRAYQELGVDVATQAPVPCAALLTEIVTRLTDIFGRSRRVAILMSVAPVLLPPDVRRALVLIGSELVINALKYGFPTAAGGRISVVLTARRGEVELVVEDDGIGMAEPCAAGKGSGLLEQLRTVIGATMTRTAGRGGHGLRVSTLVPIDPSPGENA